ncbi:unnamed protein product [Trifolium pratense]|uniref:Uncharacterized protein n=1 Tax=Trifolium pratense TaxID=57577 RepID=A0ACB0IU61_TRIPR|nr:unnamed protein product [Trifolium pratense]
MEERDLPLLLKYITETYEEQGFVDMRRIVEMEVEVFSTLEWELPTVTPFDFLRYFVYLFYTESPQEPQAVEHVLAILKDVNLMDHRPSTITLAATLMVAFDAALTREIMDLHIVRRKLGFDNKENCPRKRSHCP